MSTIENPQPSTSKFCCQELRLSRSVSRQTNRHRSKSRDTPQSRSTSVPRRSMSRSRETSTMERSVSHQTNRHRSKSRDTPQPRSTSVPRRSMSRSRETSTMEHTEHNPQPGCRSTQNFVPGSLCWAKLDGHPWWPAMVVGQHELGCPDCGPGKTWVYWFGEGRISVVKGEKVCAFVQNFKHKHTQKRSKVYQNAVMECCKLVAKTRCHLIDHWNEEKCMEWAVQGFQQSALQGERSCPSLEGVPPSIKTVIDEINEKEMEKKAKKPRKSGMKSQFGTSSSSLLELTKPCLVGLERCDAIVIQHVKMLSFNDTLSSVLLPKLGFKYTSNTIINPDVDSLPEKSVLLELGSIDLFIGGASACDKQSDSLYRHLFECYRIVTVLGESNSRLQWVFHSPLSVSQDFVETANRFFACHGVILKERVTTEQRLFWTNVASLKKVTTEVRM